MSTDSQSECDVCGESFKSPRAASIHETKSHDGREWDSRDVLKELYFEKEKSTEDIADEYGVTAATICKALRRHGFEPRERIEGIRVAKGSDPVPIKIHKDGYREWATKIDNTWHGVRVHRLAAVAWFGFDEVVGKDIHHKNGFRLDNRESNLSPMTRSEHMKLHWDQRRGKSD